MGKTRRITRNRYLLVSMVVVLFALLPALVHADKRAPNTGEPDKVQEKQVDTPTQLDQPKIAVPATTTQAMAGEQILWQVISGGGTDGSSSSYQLKGTCSQTAVGAGNSASYDLSHGFWQESATGGPECCGQYTGGITGNANCSTDGKLTLSDITRLIDFVYISKLALCCHANGNTNGSADCKITLSDITKLIDAVYISKIPPATCMAECEE